jgi:hypothetical protein
MAHQAPLVAHHGHHASRIEQRAHTLPGGREFCIHTPANLQLNTHRASRIRPNPLHWRYFCPALQGVASRIAHRASRIIHRSSRNPNPGAGSRL